MRIFPRVWETWAVGTSFLGIQVEVPLGIVAMIIDLIFWFTCVECVALSVFKQIGAALF